MLLAINATTLPLLSEPNAWITSPLAILGPKEFASGVATVRFEKQTGPPPVDVIEPVTLKFQSVVRPICTVALDPPLFDSNDPSYIPLTVGNRVAVNDPESPFMQVPVEVKVPENWLLFDELVPVKVTVAPLSSTTVTTAV